MDRYRILRNIVSGWIVISLVCLSLSGCGEQAPEPPPKPKEVRKKIAARPGPPKSETLATADGSASDQSPGPEQKTGTPEPEKAAPELPPQPATVPKDDDPQKTTVTKTETTESGTGAEETSDTALPSDIPDGGEVDGGEMDESLAAISGMDAEDADKFTASYSPKGKVDPFEPLLREESKKTENRPPETRDETVASSKPKPPPRRLTPLERLDLGQLKLVGIIRAETGNKALVEEASGKGYIIVKGTYIGIHSGIVVDILPDRVVVEEQDEDVLGKVTVRKRELKFNRPEGEDYYEM